MLAAVMFGTTAWIADIAPPMFTAKSWLKDSLTHLLTLSLRRQVS